MPVAGGWVEVEQGGKLIVPQAENQNGLGGRGLIEGNVDNLGFVLPGDSFALNASEDGVDTVYGIGTLSIDGQYVQTGDGAIEVQLAGTVAYDSLDVSGSAIVAGRLDVSTSFSPQLGETFDVITAGSVAGAFDVVDFSQTVLDPGLAWEVHYYPTTVTLEVVQADIALDRFYDDRDDASDGLLGDDVLVDYALGHYTLPFVLEVARSPDGTTTDAVTLFSQEITEPAMLSPGSHTIVLTPDFVDVQEDYKLLAMVDEPDVDTSNNDIEFEGGMFFTQTGGVIHVHGSDAGDSVNVPMAGAITRVDLNGYLGDFSDQDYTVSEVHIRSHGATDTITSNPSVTKTLWQFGGPGNDTLEGGGGNDYFEGGAGDDTYRFGGSSSLGEDQILEDDDVDTDTLDFSALGVAVTADLTGSVTTSPSTLTITLLTAAGIEDVLGTVFDDTILGNTRGNRLEGRDGSESQALYLAA